MTVGSEWTMGLPPSCAGCSATMLGSPLDWVHERDKDTGVARVFCGACGGAVVRKMMDGYRERQQRK